MERNLFLGDEAIAQAAIDAGLSGVYAYPGTPSTEITEYIQSSSIAKERGIHIHFTEFRICRAYNNNYTAAEQRCFLRCQCQDVISTTNSEFSEVKTWMVS